MKNLKSLGKALKKAEQKEINGGAGKPFICNYYEPGVPTVICKHKSLCRQDSNGNWYCA